MTPRRRTPWHLFQSASKGSNFKNPKHGGRFMIGKKGVLSVGFAVGMLAIVFMPSVSAGFGSSVKETKPLQKPLAPYKSLQVLVMASKPVNQKHIPYFQEVFLEQIK